MNWVEQYRDADCMHVHAPFELESTAWQLI